MRRFQSGEARAAFVAAAAALVAVACSSFDGAEAAHPTVASDAGAARDAEPDSPARKNEEDAAGGRFCESVDAAFCSDFDGPELLGEWDNATREGGGELTAVESDRSTSTALRTTTPSFDAGVAPVATLTRQLAGLDSSRMEISFDLAPDAHQLQDNGSVTMAQLDVFAGSTRTGTFGLVVTKSGPKLFTKYGPGTEEYQGLRPFPTTRRWVRVTIEAKDGAVVAKFDGEEAAPAVPFAASSDRGVFSIGVLTQVVGGDHDLSFDDVVVRQLP